MIHVILFISYVFFMLAMYLWYRSKLKQMGHSARDLINGAYNNADKTLKMHLDYFEPLKKRAQELAQKYYKPGDAGRDPFDVILTRYEEMQKLCEDRNGNAS